MPQIIDIHSPEYRHAFSQYLRKGTPIHISMKALLATKESAQEHITTQYIWRTRGDDKVRGSHAANNGKIFAWTNPPATGHPGDEPGCRCWAEPLFSEVNRITLSEESVVQTLLTDIRDQSPRWDNHRMLEHYRHGDGQAVSLAEMGHLSEVIRHAEYFPLEGGKTIYRRVENYMLDLARENGEGLFEETSVRPYNFGNVEWAHGHSRVLAHLRGFIRPWRDFYIFSGTIDYRFTDAFRDPLDIGVEVGGTPYMIYGNWRTRIEALIFQDRKRSGYIRPKEEER